MTAQSIVVGVDQSPGAQHALCWAARYAYDNHLDVVAVHVLTYSTEFSRDLSLQSLTNWRRHLQQRLEQQWVQPLRDAVVPYRTSLVEDDTVESGLLTIAARTDATLIVLGAHRHHEIKDRLVRGVTDKITHRADRPVVIVPTAWSPPDRTPTAAATTTTHS